MKNTHVRALYLIIAIITFFIPFNKITCPHCKTHRIKRVARKHYFVSIFNCQKCYLYFAYPTMGNLLARLLYSSKFYAENDLTTEIPNKTELKKLIKSKFINSGKDFNNRIECIKKAFGIGTLLEFGSSWGYFLCQARTAGFNVTGIEVSKPRSSFGRSAMNLEICNSFSELEKKKYDIIYSSHVLEHLLDLSKIFTDFNEHLSNNGVLIIEVPNFNYKELGNKILSGIGAVHPLGFSPEFFYNNMEKIGFRELMLYNTYESIVYGKNDFNPKNDCIIAIMKK